MKKKKKRKKRKKRKKKRMKKRKMTLLARNSKRRNWTSPANIQPKISSSGTRKPPQRITSCLTEMLALSSNHRSDCNIQWKQGRGDVSAMRSPLWRHQPTPIKNQEENTDAKAECPINHRLMLGVSISADRWLALSSHQPTQPAIVIVNTISCCPNGCHKSPPPSSSLHLLLLLFPRSPPSHSPVTSHASMVSQ